MKRLIVLLLLSLLIGGSACSAVESREKEPQEGIPFELVGLHTFIDVVLAGEKLSFVFDTGASGIALDELTARRLELTTRSGGTSTGAVGSREVRIAAGLTLDVGPVNLANRSAIVLPLDHLADRIGRPVDGIIGRDVLARRIVVIDYDRSVLHFLDRPPRSTDPWGKPCRIDTEYGLMAVEAEVVLSGGDTLKGRFFFDSGAGLYLTFNTPFAREHELRRRVGKTFERTSHALTGKTSTEIHGRVAEFRFCGHVFPGGEVARDIGGVPVRISQGGEGVQAFESHAGILGNGILMRYNLAIDLAHRRLWLRPNDLSGEPIRADGSGIRIKVVAGRTIVDSVIDGSPAAEAGVDSGDEFVAVDGEPAAELTLEEVRDRLSALGTTVELRLWRGDVVRSVLLDLRLLYADVEID